MKRHKTKYPGVFYREANRLGGPGKERVYYIVFKKDGKIYEEKVGRQFADDMTPARANQIRSQRIEGKRPSRRELRAAAKETKWTIDRLWEQYLSDKPDTKSWRTDRYRYNKFLKDSFGQKEPKDISPLDTHRLRLQLAKNLAPQTVKHVLVLLTRIINFGLKKGLCQGLSFKVEMPKVYNIKTEDLSLEQMAKLLEALAKEPDIQAANFMKLALLTGMRRSELFKLTWDDIDFERGFIHIRDPKGRKDQKIPLNPEARTVLLNHPRLESSFVFPGRNGKQRTRNPRRIDAIRKACGLPADFRPLHGLRHTFASSLASSGQVDLYTLQKLLTHKSPAMTQRYAHLRDEALKRAAALAGTLVNRAINGNNLPQAVLQD
ncbi:MAG: site-specific integrase [Desulfobaccales bacterium]